MVFAKQFLSGGVDTVASGKHLYGMQKGRYIFGTAKVGE